MLHHEEKSATALAHGPAKPDDIERARHDVETAERNALGAGQVDRAIGDLEAACETVREDLTELKRVVSVAEWRDLTSRA